MRRFSIDESLEAQNLALWNALSFISTRLLGYRTSKEKIIFNRFHPRVIYTLLARLSYLSLQTNEGFLKEERST